MIKSFSKFRQSKKKLTIILVGCVLGIIVIVKVFIPTVDTVLMVSLHIEAISNRNHLNSLKLLDNYEFQVSAAPNGDFVTARSSPARAVLDINEEAKKVHEEIANNLSVQGYMISPNVTNMWYGDSFLVHRIGTTATDGVHNLKIYYYLDEAYACRELIGSQDLYNCPDDVVAKADLLKRRIERVEVIYDPRSGPPQNINLTGREYWSN